MNPFRVMAAAMAENPVFVQKGLFGVPEYPGDGGCSCQNVSLSNVYQTSGSGDPDSNRFDSNPNCKDRTVFQ